MPVTTVSAAVHITPGKLRPIVVESSELTRCGGFLVVVKTFLKHYKNKGQKYARGDAGEASTDDIFFDECVLDLFDISLSFRNITKTTYRGFNIVKAFIELGTLNTVESLQALCVNRARTQSIPHSH